MNISIIIIIIIIIVIVIIIIIIIIRWWVSNVFLELIFPSSRLEDSNDLSTEKLPAWSWKLPQFFVNGAWNVFSF